MNPTLKQDIQQYLKEIKVDLYNVSWEKEFGNNILRIIVDEPGKVIDMQRIIEISRYLSKYFDENEPTDKDYNLEVLSAGIERELLNLNHWEKSIDKLVFIVLKNPINNVKRLYGYVKEVKNGKILIQINDDNKKEYELTIKDIKTANWAFMEEENAR